MRNRIWVYFTLTLSVAALIALIFGFSKDADSNIEDYQKEFRENYSIYAIDIPSELFFAGEQVPIDNFDTRESLDREILVNTYFHSNTLLMIKRSNRFFPVIEPILNKNGIPDDFKYLSVAESGLENGTSPSGAVGFWQFLEGTGKEYGLVINEEVDERYHLEKSTEAACKYLNKTYKNYQNWTLVAASYNNGKSGLDRQIDIQKIKNYYDLLLNEETARYVFRIIALKLIMSNPNNFGFYYRNSDLYPPIETYIVEINAAVADFAEFAGKYGINYKILKYFNPWLRKPYLTNKNNDTFFIKIPFKFEREFIKVGL